ncbi:GTPase [Marinobacter changyiensis]|uniref:GTPase n=1 Tax=Marinobacter changyiensis TaxID=2604091 RepID=UPI001264CC7F|nr:GTPase [Marinobacter changyiensis]
MEGKTLKPDLTVTEQKIASLSFCETTPRGFGAWIGRLPMANIGEVSRQLYHAIIELNQLFLAPPQRLQLLELIRPKIHFVCNELSRHYLGLAIALPEKQRKIANLSQALRLHLANGYKACLLELLDAGPAEKNRKLIGICCHRALSDLGATIVRAHQLYCPSPAKSWLECHRIYRFAYRNKLLNIVVEDDTLLYRKSSTVSDAYNRILLLGCARPNQLRQNELMRAYELFEAWTDLVVCRPDLQDPALFVINMERDSAPIYRSLRQQESNGDCFGFDTTELAQRISEYLHARTDRGQPDTKTGIPLPAAVSDTLLAHLSQALGILTKRNFNRITSQGRLEVCVGLTAAHYFIAGERTFNRFVSGNNTAPEDDNNVFLSGARQRNDAWAGAHDAGPDDVRISADTPITFRGSGGPAETGVPEKNRPRSYQTLLINTSPGGYCVGWEADVPPALQAGEILGVREQRSHPWSVAVVRWIRQIRNQGTQVGVELLAPSASPCGVRLIQKVGNSSEFLRGLLLPEIGAVKQAATLITPRLPFQSGSRIVLLHDGREDQGQLSRRVSATGSVSQFELKLQNSGERDNIVAEAASGTACEDEFDSLWPSL